MISAENYFRIEEKCLRIGDRIYDRFDETMYMISLIDGIKVSLIDMDTGKSFGCSLVASPLVISLINESDLINMLRTTTLSVSEMLLNEDGTPLTEYFGRRAPAKTLSVGQKFRYDGKDYTLIRRHGTYRGCVGICEDYKTYIEHSVDNCRTLNAITHEEFKMIVGNRYNQIELYDVD